MATLISLSFTSLTEVPYDCLYVSINNFPSYKYLNSQHNCKTLCKGFKKKIQIGQKLNDLK